MRFGCAKWTAVHDSQLIGYLVFYSAVEATHSALDGGERWDADLSQVVDICELEPDTRVRLTRHSCVRLIRPDNQCVETVSPVNKVLYRLFNAANNTRIYHEVEPTYLEIEDEVRKPSLQIKLYVPYKGVVFVKISNIFNQFFLFRVWRKYGSIKNAASWALCVNV